MSGLNFPKDIRHLEITDLERIERFRKAGYGGGSLTLLRAWASRTQSFPTASNRCARGCNWSGAPYR